MFIADLALNSIVLPLCCKLLIKYSIVQRLVRNTVVSMILLLRAKQQRHSHTALKCPSKQELLAMTERLVEFYPMLLDKEGPVNHVSDSNV